MSPGRRGHWRRHCSLVPDVIVWLTAPQPGLAQTGLQGVTPHPRPSTGRRVRTCPRVGMPGPGASFPQGLSQLQRAGPGWRGQDPTPGRSAKAAGDVFAGWPSRAPPTRPAALPASVWGWGRPARCLEGSRYRLARGPQPPLLLVSRIPAITGHPHRPGHRGSPQPLQLLGPKSQKPPTKVRSLCKRTRRPA